MRGLRTPRWTAGTARHGMRRLMAASALVLAAPLAAQDFTDVTLRTGIGFSAVGEGYLPFGEERAESQAAAGNLLVGVDFGLPLGGALALRPGLSYVRKGPKRYLQLSLPVARHRVVSRGRLFLEVEAGPWFAVRTSASRVEEGRSLHIRGADLGFGGGLGVSYGITDGVAIHIAAVYHMGLIDVTHNEPSPITYRGITISEPVISHWERTGNLALRAGLVFQI